MIITDKLGRFQHANFFEVGILDHRELFTTAIKAKFTMASPKYVHYRDYKNFTEQDFKLELGGKVEVDVVDAKYENFHNVCFNVLSKHAVINTKVVRGNQAPYITKAYRKVSESKTKYLKNSILENVNKLRKLYSLTKIFGLLLNHFLAIKFSNILKLLLLKAIK